MSMVKIVMPGAFGFDEPIAQHVKIASQGLRGNDLRTFVKRAGHAFVERLRNVTLHPGEEPVHFLAIGADEYYGANRNGDAFDEANCRDYHHTFEKYARFYRSHINKDPAKSYGRILASMYNPEAHRIEVLAGLNGTKEAAERNGGLVADREMEKLARGEDLPGSMASAQMYDICSGCGNRARTRKEYCDESTCKYGGLKHNMGKVAEDGHHLRALNPQPHFFDWSHVFRPADRIAYAMGQLEKAASTCVSGAELAEMAGIAAPPALLALGAPEKVAAQLALASELSELEAISPLLSAADIAFSKRAAAAPPLDLQASSRNLATVMRALADEAVLLPPNQFFTLLTGNAKEAAAANEEISTHLPGIFASVMVDPLATTLLASNPYTPSVELPPVATRNWASKLAEDFGLRPVHLQRRVIREALRETGLPTSRKSASARIKVSGTQDAAIKLATHYALYELAFLAHLKQRNEPDLQKVAAALVRQNHLV